MTTITEQLTSLNTNLNIINTEVGSQASLIAQIKAKANSLPNASGGGTSNAPQAYHLTSADELPTDAVDGSLAVVEHSDSAIGKWELHGYDDTPLPESNIEMVFTCDGAVYALIEVGSRQNFYYSREVEDLTDPVYSTTDGWYGNWYTTIEVFTEPSDEGKAWLKQVGNKVTNLTTLYSRENGEWVEGMNVGGGSGGSGDSTLNIISGTVTSNEAGEITLSIPDFEPKQIMVWNIVAKDYWAETGDESVVRYGHDGVMLCAIKTEHNHWVAHYMASASGSYFIAQASAERAPYPSIEQDYGTTNIYEENNSIIWCLGGANSDGSVNDFTDTTLNYVLIG